MENGKLLRAAYVVVIAYASVSKIYDGSDNPFAERARKTKRDELGDKISHHA